MCCSVSTVVWKETAVHVAPKGGLVVVCCGVLQCVAVCCSVLQCVAVCCSVSTIVRRETAVPVMSGDTVVVCCSMLQYVTMCCSV